jgi:phage repressor protein C with HTH and peptisase S24 domain
MKQEAQAAKELAAATKRATAATAAAARASPRSPPSPSLGLRAYLAHVSAAPLEPSALATDNATMGRLAAHHAARRQAHNSHHTGSSCCVM